MKVTIFFSRSMRTEYQHIQLLIFFGIARILSVYDDVLASLFQLTSMTKT